MWVVKKLNRGIVASSPRFLESSGKTYHTVFRSLSLSTTSFWYVWKGKMFKMVEALITQHVENGAEELKD